MEEDQTESMVMGAGGVPLQLSEDGQKELPGGGEENTQDEMVELISPPTLEEMVSLRRTWRKESWREKTCTT